MAAAAGLPLLATTTARAETAHYPMACDPALQAALQEAAELFRQTHDIVIHVLPTAPALQVPQMTHQIQNDIVMARADVVAGVDAAGYAVPGGPRARFRDRLVLAVRRDAAADAATAGPFAITDPSHGRPRDDAGILSAMGVTVGQSIGGIDSGAVAFLVAHGFARAGLMLMSDVRAHSGLKVARLAPDADAEIFIASTTRAPRRPQPEAFISFLASGEGGAILVRHGLENIT